MSNNNNINYRFKDVDIKEKKWITTCDKILVSSTHA